MNNTSSIQTQKSYLTVFLSILYLIVLLRAAWVGDDAYITFRVVDNFLNGYGLTWNISERVQVYTNPLWMFLMIALTYFAGNIYLTAVFSSIILSLLILLILYKFYNKSNNLFLVILILVSSKAFIDYSVSGLENPLNSLLITLFFVIFLNRKQNDPDIIFQLLLIASFAFLSRMDMILFFIVPLGYIFFENLFIRKIPLASFSFKFILVTSPAWMWVLFSIIYYGFPFPNTYYAKLTTGISSTDYIAQGLMYYLDLINNDPISIIVIIFSLIVSLNSKNKNLIITAISILFYCFYIFKIGGDFMAGRFFSPIVLLSCIVVLHINLDIYRISVASLLILFIAFLAPKPTWRYSTDYDNKIISNGIADERGFYYQKYGFLNNTSKERIAPEISYELPAVNVFKYNNKQVAALVNMGFSGYSLGPKYYIIDKIGLTDPFISKLPIFGDFHCHNWRVGHYERQISQQYLSSVIQGKNNFKNDSLGILYEAIKEITQGDIFSKKRFQEIININSGKYKQHALSVLRKKEFDYPISDFKLMNGNTEVILDNDSFVQTIATNINDYLFIYGPYVGLGKGKFEVNFHINGASLIEDSAVIELDVFEYGSINPTLAQTQILGKELTLHGSNQY